VCQRLENAFLSGLLKRPEHSETKAKTETETETKNLLWDRDQKLRDQDRDRDQSSQVNCMWKWHKSVCFICLLHAWGE